MTATEIVLVGLVTVLAATVQGSTGIGFTLLAGPPLLAVESGFGPGPLMVCGACISLRHLLREGGSIDRATAGRMLTGAPIGLAAAAVLLLTVPGRTLRIVTGVIVAGGAAVLLRGVHPRRSPRVDRIGGAATAFSSLAAALPGPPLAVTLHDSPAAETRATVGAVAGTIGVTGLVVLVAIGRFGRTEIGLTALLLPFVLTGLLVASVVRPWLDRSLFRPVILGIALLGGVSLAVSNLV